MSSASISLKNKIPPGGLKADKSELPHYEFIGGTPAAGPKDPEGEIGPLTVSPQQRQELAVKNSMLKLEADASKIVLGHPLYHTSKQKLRNVTQTPHGLQGRTILGDKRRLNLESTNSLGHHLECAELDAIGELDISTDHMQRRRQEAVKVKKIKGSKRSPFKK